MLGAEVVWWAEAALGAGAVLGAEAVLGMEAVLGVEFGMAAVAALVLVVAGWPWVVVVLHQLSWADCPQ